MYKKLEVAVVIPCYNEEKLIGDTVAKLPKYIDHIVTINDASTDSTLKILNKLRKSDPRIHVVNLDKNQGVGGAIIAGYNYVLENTKSYAIGIVAGDDQFDTAYLSPMLVSMIENEADYVKASRFFHREAFKQMPRYRQFGNIFISLLTKFSTGYYSITDITNGCGWLKRSIIEKVDFSIVERRYDYETSMLTALSIVDAKVIDHAVPAHYGEEKSSIKLIPTAWRNIKAVWRGFWRRIYYKYVLFGFHPVALFLFSGVLFLILALIVSIFILWNKLFAGAIPTVGSVMLAVLPLIISFQLTLTALTMDVSNEKRHGH